MANGVRKGKKAKLVKKVKNKHFDKFPLTLILFTKTICNAFTLMIYFFIVFFYNKTIYITTDIKSYAFLHREILNPISFSVNLNRGQHVSS